MIYVRLMGGLGNQLYQYAAGRRLALRLSSELVLDTSALDRRLPKETPRPFELHRFNVKARVAAPDELNVPRALIRFPFLGGWFNGPGVFRERSLDHDARFESVGDNTLLVGYWQSYRYFQDIAATIRSELTPIGTLSPGNTDLLRAIEAYDAVSIHVRRGDYVSLANAAGYHGALGIEYYTAAVRHVAERLAAPWFFVFSDDPDWARANLPLPRNRTTVVTGNAEDNAWQDLMLMRRCKHHIIANSSFSWWGAWLAEDQPTDDRRIVIAPRRWLLTRPINAADRFPSHWTTI